MLLKNLKYCNLASFLDGTTLIIYKAPTEKKDGLGINPGNGKEVIIPSSRCNEQVHYSGMYNPENWYIPEYRKNTLPDKGYDKISDATDEQLDADTSRVSLGVDSVFYSGQGSTAANVRANHEYWHRFPGCVGMPGPEVVVNEQDLSKDLISWVGYKKD